MMLLNIIIRPVQGLGRAFILRLVVNCRKKDYLYSACPRISPYGLTDLETVHGWKSHIEKHDIRSESEGKIQSLFPVMAGDYVERLRSQDFLHCGTKFSALMRDKHTESSGIRTLFCSQPKNGRTSAASQFDTGTADFLFVKSEPGPAGRTTDKHSERHSFEYESSKLCQRSQGIYFIYREKPVDIEQHDQDIPRQAYSEKVFGYKAVRYRRRRLYVTYRHSYHLGNIINNQTNSLS